MMRARAFDWVRDGEVSSVLLLACCCERRVVSALQWLRLWGSCTGSVAVASHFSATRPRHLITLWPREAPSALPLHHFRYKAASPGMPSGKLMTSA